MNLKEQQTQNIDKEILKNVQFDFLTIDEVAVLQINRRICKATEYASEHGACTYDNNKCCYWTKNPNIIFSDQALFIDEYGKYQTEYISQEYIAIRPIIRLSNSNLFYDLKDEKGNCMRKWEDDTIVDLGEVADKVTYNKKRFDVNLTNQKTNKDEYIINGEKYLLEGNKLYKIEKCKWFYNKKLNALISLKALYAHKFSSEDYYYGNFEETDIYKLMDSFIRKMLIPSYIINEYKEIKQHRSVVTSGDTQGFIDIHEKRQASPRQYIKSLKNSKSSIRKYLKY